MQTSDFVKVFWINAPFWNTMWWEKPLGSVMYYEYWYWPELVKIYFLPLSMQHLANKLTFCDMVSEWFKDQLGYLLVNPGACLDSNLALRLDDK